VSEEPQLGAVAAADVVTPMLYTPGRHMSILDSLVEDLYSALDSSIGGSPSSKRRVCLCAGLLDQHGIPTVL